jgi:hypothetical protein
MALISLTLVTIWTFLILRVLGGRATLSARTFGRYMLVGALWGPLSLGVFYAVTSGRPPYPPQILIATGFFSPLVLWIPVCVCLLLERQVFRFVSVADAFLLGFAVGLGFDVTVELFGLGFREVAREGLPHWLTLLPPSILSYPGYNYRSFAQDGYWLAMPSLIMVAGLRFLRRPSVKIGRAHV